MKRRPRADYVIAAGTLAYLVVAALPWFSYAGFGVEFSVRGLDFTLVGAAVVLFVLATGWALLPTVADVAVGFPRGFITLGLAVLGWILTFFAWLDSLSVGFSIGALLAVVVAAVIGLFAVRALRSELSAELPSELPSELGSEPSGGQPGSSG